jgi:hypothetical protein
MLAALTLTALFLTSNLLLRKEADGKKVRALPDIYFKQSVNDILTEQLPEDLKKKRKQWLAWKEQQRKKSFVGKFISYLLGTGQEPSCLVKKLSDYLGYILVCEHPDCSLKLNKIPRVIMKKLRYVIIKKLRYGSGPWFYFDKLNSCIHVGSGPGITLLSEDQLKKLIDCIIVAKRGDLLENNKLARWFFRYPEALKLFLQKRLEVLGSEKAQRCINEPWSFEMSDDGYNKKIQQNLLGFAVLSSLCFHPHDDQPQNDKGNLHRRENIDSENQKKIIKILLGYGAKVDQVFARPWAPDGVQIERKTKRIIDYFQGFFPRLNVSENFHLDWIKGGKVYNLVFPHHTLNELEKFSLQAPMSLLEWYLHTNPGGIDPEIYDILVQASSNKGLCEQLKPFELLAKMANSACNIRNSEIGGNLFELLNKKIQQEPPYIWYKSLKESGTSLVGVYGNMQNILGSQDIQNYLNSVTNLEQQKEVREFRDQYGVFKKKFNAIKGEEQAWKKMLHKENLIDFKIIEFQ